jgi:hypothetical protein
VDLVTREATVGLSRFRGFHRRPLQLPERVEAFEFQPAVIAQQLMQSSHLKYDRRIFIAALDTRTLASGTPHDVLRSLSFVLSRSNEAGTAGPEDCSKRQESPPDIYLGTISWQKREAK